MNSLCSHFGTCGGCTSQHLSYEEELRQKSASLQNLFFPLTPLPIIPCTPFLEYRNKMEFSFSQDRKGEKFLGLMMKRGRVVTLSECHLCPPWFVEALKATQDWWKESDLDAYYPPQDRGVLRTLTLREGKRTGEKMALLTTSGTPFAEHHLKNFSKKLRDIVHFDSLIWRQQITEKKKPTRFVEHVLQGKDHIHEALMRKGVLLKFKIRASSFFQPNTLQAEKLIEKALDMAGLSKEETLFDLYCGTATLGIFAASSVKQVYGVELNPDAIMDARANATLNGISNITLIEGDVGEALPKNVLPDCVFVDPPRSGLGPKATAQILALKPKRIIYISCNPKTQAEDLKTLTSHYRISVIQPVDQFPRTPHIENIVALD